MDTIWYSGLTCSNFISQEDKLTRYSNLHKQLVNENTSILLILTSTRLLKTWPTSQPLMQLSCADKRTWGTSSSPHNQIQMETIGICRCCNRLSFSSPNSFKQNYKTSAVFSNVFTLFSDKISINAPSFANNDTVASN